MTSGDDHGREPERLDRRRVALYLLATPLVLALVLFLPAGTWAWPRGWLFVLVFLLAMGLSALYLWRVNPEIFAARRRIHEGTKRWDRILLAFLFPAMAAIVVVAALDDGRFHWSAVPGWACGLGYALLLAGMGITAWRRPSTSSSSRASASRRSGATGSSTPAPTPSCVIPATWAPACCSWASPCPWARSGR